MQDHLHQQLSPPLHPTPRTQTSSESQLHHAEHSFDQIPLSIIMILLPFFRACQVLPKIRLRFQDCMDISCQVYRCACSTYVRFIPALHNLLVGHSPYSHASSKETAQPDRALDSSTHLILPTTSPGSRCSIKWNYYCSNFH